jgi:hypothetical protein
MAPQVIRPTIVAMDTTVTARPPPATAPALRDLADAYAERLCLATASTGA